MTEISFKYPIGTEVYHASKKKTITKQILEVTREGSQINYLVESITKIPEDRIVPYGQLHEIFRDVRQSSYNDDKPYAFMDIFGHNSNLVEQYNFPFNRNIVNIPEHFYGFPEHIILGIMDIYQKSGYDAVYTYIDNNMKEWVRLALERSNLNSSFSGVISHDIETFGLSYKFYYANNNGYSENELANMFGDVEKTREIINKIMVYFFTKLIKITKTAIPYCKQTVYDCVPFEYWLMYNAAGIKQYKQLLSDRTRLFKQLDYLTSSFYTTYKVVSPEQYVSDGSAGEKVESNLVPYQTIAELGKSLGKTIKRPFGVWISPNLKGIDPMYGEYAGDLALINIIQSAKLCDFVIFYNWLSNETNNQKVVEDYNINLRRFYDLWIKYGQRS